MPSFVLGGVTDSAKGSVTLDGEQFISLEPARSFDEGINYDKRIVLELDQAADDGEPRLWLSALVCLIVISEEGVPVRVET